VLEVPILHLSMILFIQKVHAPAIKEHAFKALVRPKLESRITIWDPHTQQQKLPIEKIQTDFASFNDSFYWVFELFRQCGIFVFVFFFSFYFYGYY
jgi:hypothetical protein